MAVHQAYIPIRILIRAALVTESNTEEVAAWCDGTSGTSTRMDGTTFPVVYVRTPWGIRTAEPGMYVIQDPVDGSFMPWQGEHFIQHFTRKETPDG